MEIVLMNHNTITPTRASKESAGLDLYSSIGIYIVLSSIKKVVVINGAFWDDLEQNFQTFNH